jgi:hypothetical protein
VAKGKRLKRPSGQLRTSNGKGARILNLTDELTGLRKKQSNVRIKRRIAQLEQELEAEFSVSAPPEEQAG